MIHSNAFTRYMSRIALSSYVIAVSFRTHGFPVAVAMSVRDASSRCEPRSADHERIHEVTHAHMRNGWDFLQPVVRHVEAGQDSMPKQKQCHPFHILERALTLPTIAATVWHRHVLTSVSRRSKECSLWRGAAAAVAEQQDETSRVKPRRTGVPLARRPDTPTKGNFKHTISHILLNGCLGAFAARDDAIWPVVSASA